MNSTTLDISESLEHLDFFSYMLMEDSDYYHTLGPKVRKEILACVEDINNYSNLYWISEEEQAILDFLAVTLTREED